MIRGRLRGLARRLGRALHERTVIDMEDDFLAAWDCCRPFTMTSIERAYALWKAVEHVVRSGVPGDVVECGTWRGGSAMVCALALLRCGDRERGLHLFDTFRGMPEPTDRDVSASRRPARERWLRAQAAGHNRWCYAAVDEVRANLARTGFPTDRLRFVEGLVEDTLPAAAPARIAVLHLDTDWYASTHHELCHLFPRLSSRGVLVLDDYGHWRGGRAAADDYLATLAQPLLLHRSDETGRVAVKP